MTLEAFENYKMVSEFIDKGMNIARINTAHGSPGIWEGMIKNIRKAEKNLGKPCRIFMDIAGPKTRISWIFSGEGKRKVNVGDRFMLSGMRNISTDPDVKLIIGCSIPTVPEDLTTRDSVLIDDGDGAIEGNVEDILDEGIVVRVHKVQVPKGVQLKVDKGINFPDAYLKVDIVTEKDRHDLNFICTYADIIGFSFAKSARDIDLFFNEITKRVSLKKASSIPTIVKIETIAEVKNLPEIIMAAAGNIVDV